MDICNRFDGGIPMFTLKTGVYIEVNKLHPPPGTECTYFLSSSSKKKRLALTRISRKPVAKPGEKAQQSGLCEPR